MTRYRLVVLGQDRGTYDRLLDAFVAAKELLRTAKQVQVYGDDGLLLHVWQDLPIVVDGRKPGA